MTADKTKQREEQIEILKLEKRALNAENKALKAEKRLLKAQVKELTKPKEQYRLICRNGLNWEGSR